MKLSPKIKKWAIVFLCLTTTIGVFQACKSYYFRSTYDDANALIHATSNLKEKPFLKAHLKNGDVSIFNDKWSVDTLDNTISGNGNSYDFNRKSIYEGPLKIDIDEVLILETNLLPKDQNLDKVTALTILATADLALTGFCAINPKACFGSCPTFYLHEGDNFHSANAEGFSNAIFPSLEYADIDALQNVATHSGNYSIYLKNEALETHCIRDLKLVAAPRKESHRVFHDRKNLFYDCNNFIPPSTAWYEGKDIATLLGDSEGEEWFSLADSNNLNSKEEIILTFKGVSKLKRPALHINFRQSLMTTYFIYSALGYMGDEASDIIAKVEAGNGDVEKLKNGIQKLLGDIEVYVWNYEYEAWVKQGGFYETGPIAHNHQLLPLSGTHGENIKLKILLNKGLWRIDQLELTDIIAVVKPIELSVEKILIDGQADVQELRKLHSADQHLISLPGDRFELQFRLPEGKEDYELFMYSKGYYLEWMRESWIREKNHLKLYEMLNMPESYLKSEAKAYKQYEKTMEQQFWNSRINHKIFS